MFYTTEHITSNQYPLPVGFNKSLEGCLAKIVEYLQRYQVKNLTWEAWAWDDQQGYTIVVQGNPSRFTFFVRICEMGE